MDIIRSEVEHYINERNFKLRTTNHLRNTNIFKKNVLMEDNSDRKAEVLTLIKNNEWENNPQEFYDSLKQSKHSLMLTDYTPAELSKMKLFKLKGYRIGYALKEFNGSYEIVAVHNNEPEIGGIGHYLVQSAINNGGCYLDHFDGVLSDLYSGLGFVEYKRDSYDPQYDPEGEFKNKYGASDVIYRVHKNCKHN